MVIVLFDGVNPKAFCFPLNVVQSVEVKIPLTLALALLNVFCLVENLDVKFKELVSEKANLLLNVFQSVEVKNPFALVVACVIDKVLLAVKSPPPCNGAVVPIFIVLFAGVNPKALCLLLNVVQSVEVKYPFLPVVALNNSMTGVVVVFEIDKGFPLVAETVTLVTVPLPLPTPAPMAVRKSVADKAETLLSTLNLGKVIAEGLVKVNIDCPIVVPPKLVLPVADTKSVLPPSHFNLSV